jgi:hypothetical protein
MDRDHWPLTRPLASLGAQGAGYLERVAGLTPLGACIDPTRFSTSEERSNRLGSRCEARRLVGRPHHERGR